MYTNSIYHMHDYNKKKAVSKSFVSIVVGKPYKIIKHIVSIL